MSKLFQPTEMKGQALANRVVMAPMTRARSTQPGNIANAMMAQYYQQRASAGLIISEATQISDDSQGYSFTPGVYTDAQVQGWQQVTSAVHAKGAPMFCQLWHVGRVSHPVFQKGELPIAPSALAPVETKVWIADENGNGQMVDCIEPRAMTQADIDRVVNDFAFAAKRAIEAGFDGVEIHGGNGYLIDQFLRTNSNKRTDRYGGSRENRMRFLLEVVDAVIEAIGADKVGVRLAPFITFKDMNCPDIVPTILQASQQLQARDIAYLHLSEADWDDAPTIQKRFVSHCASLSAIPLSLLDVTLQHVRRRCWKKGTPIWSRLVVPLSLTQIWLAVWRTGIHWPSSMAQRCLVVIRRVTPTIRILQISQVGESVT